MLAIGQQLVERTRRIIAPLVLLSVEQLSKKRDLAIKKAIFTACILFVLLLLILSYSYLCVPSNLKKKSNLLQ